MTFAWLLHMRRYLVLFIGILIGQWFAFAGLESPAAVNRLAGQAGARGEWAEAARQWSRAVSLQPDNAYFNYMRAAALARLGHRQAAGEGLELALLLQPGEPLAHQIRSELATLSFVTGAEQKGESVVPLENNRGVWMVHVVMNGRDGRFLVDTGSSVIVVAPTFAGKAGAKLRAAETLELETLGGRVRAPWATIASLRVGGAELRNADVVVHHPGGEIDGILGNSFLARWDVSVDPDRRLLKLRPLAAAVYASPK
jgi:clan AA aspartic protease (TIGR02281 family)